MLCRLSVLTLLAASALAHLDLSLLDNQWSEWKLTHRREYGSQVSGGGGGQTPPLTELSACFWVTSSGRSASLRPVPTDGKTRVGAAGNGSRNHGDAFSASVKQVPNWGIGATSGRLCGDEGFHEGVSVAAAALLVEAGAERKTSLRPPQLPHPGTTKLQPSGIKASQ